MQYLDILMVAYEVLVRCVIAQGDHASAEQAIREMERVNQLASIPLFRPWIESLWVHLWLAQGDLVRAVDWAEHTPYHQEPFVYSYESASLALVGVYLATLQYPQALQLLAGLRSSAEHVARVGSMISILALQVVALQASGATQEALHVLHRWLTLAEPEGYVRVFLDAGAPMHQALQAWLTTEQEVVSPVLAAYARRVCETFACTPLQTISEQRITLASPSVPSTPVQAVSPLLEPLTPRELEVLHLLATGAFNQEIARQLVVSLPTAKKHVASILSKFGVGNRTQAIAYARSLSLL